MYLLDLGGWDIPERLAQPPVVEPVHPVEGRQLDAANVAIRSNRSITSALWSPVTVSAGALPHGSPTLPTEGSMPASASPLRATTLCSF